MAETYYYSVNAPAISPAFASAWEDTDNNKRGQMAASSSGEITASNTMNVTTSNKDAMLYQFVSEALSAGTIGDQMDVEFQIKISSTSSLATNFSVVRFRLVDSGGTEKNDVLISGSALGTSYASDTISYSPSDWSVDAGDRFVVEIGALAKRTSGSGNYTFDLKVTGAETIEYAGSLGTSTPIEVTPAAATATATTLEPAFFGPNDGGHSATTAAATAGTPTSTVEATTGISYAAETATATMQARLESISVDKTAAYTATQDTYVNEEATGTSYDTATEIIVDRDLVGSDERWTFIRFGAIPTQVLDGDVKVHVNSRTGVGPEDVIVESVDADWTDSTLTWGNKPSTGTAYSQEFTINTGDNTWDITSLVAGWGAGSIDNYGLVIRPAATGFATGSDFGIISIEHGDTADHPTLTIKYREGTQNINVTPDLITATADSPDAAPGVRIDATTVTATDALSPDATVDTTSTVDWNASEALSVAAGETPAISTGITHTADVSIATADSPDSVSEVGLLYNADTATATADFPVPVVTTPDYTEYATVATATAGSDDAGVYTEIELVYAADEATATASSDAAGFNNDTPVEWDAETATATAQVLSLPYDESRDPFFVRINELNTAPLWWFRFQEESGTQALNIGSNGVGADTERHGVYRGAPSFENEAPIDRSSVCFDGTNQYMDWDIGGQNLSSTAVEIAFKTSEQNTPLLAGGGNEFIRITNGKIEVSSPFTNKRYIGLIDVADDEWHFVQVVFDNTITSAAGNQLRLYVDNEVDILRADAHNEANFDRAGRQGTEYFSGCMAEIVIHRTPYSHEVLKFNYYAWIATNIIRTDMMNMVADAPNAIGEGNVRNALALIYKLPVYSALDAPDYIETGQFATELESRHWSNLDVPYQAKQYTIGDSAFSMNHVRINGHYNPVNDTNDRWIDLEDDLDVTRFRLITVVDIPNVAEMDHAERQLFKAFCLQLRDAAAAGVPVLIHHPEIASELGLIDDLKSVDDAYDQFGDQYAWDNLDWALPEVKKANGDDIETSFFTPPIDDPVAANEFLDNHYIDHFVVANEVAGITDIEDTRIDVNERFVYLDSVPVYESQRWAYNVNRGAWEVGDAIPITNARNPQEQGLVLNQKRTSVIPGLFRNRKLWGTTSHAGIAIAKGQLTHSTTGNNSAPAGTADMVFSFLLEAGEVVKGVSLNAPIIVDFLGTGYEPEDVHTNGQALTDDDFVNLAESVPPNATRAEKIAAGQNHPWYFTDWDYDNVRNIYDATTGLTYDTVLEKFQPLPAQRFIGYLHPYEAEPFYPLSYRFLQYMNGFEPLPEGYVQVRATSVTATAGSPDATVTIETTVSVTTNTAQAAATMHDPDEAPSPDVNWVAFTATAIAASPNVTKTHYADTATATTEVKTPTVTTVVIGIPMIVHRPQYVPMYIES